MLQVKLLQFYAPSAYVLLEQDLTVCDVRLSVAILFCSAMYRTAAVRWLGHPIVREVATVNTSLVSPHREVIAKGEQRGAAIGKEQVN